MWMWILNITLATLGGCLGIVAIALCRQAQDDDVPVPDALAAAHGVRPIPPAAYVTRLDIGLGPVVGVLEGAGDVPGFRWAQRVGPVLKRRARRVAVVFGYVLAGYVVLCLPNTIALNRALSPLADDFRETAWRTRAVASNGAPEYRALTADGALDRIIARRDRILRQNDGFLLGVWWAYQQDTVSRPEVIISWAFCYHPFRRISGGHRPGSVRRTRSDPARLTRSAPSTFSIA